MVVGSVMTGVATDRVNYAGKYSLQERKTASGTQVDSTIEVVQSEDRVEVTRVEQGKKTTNVYPSNGSEGSYASPRGVPGKCKAEFKGKYLVLESTVVVRPQASAPPVRIHTKERWQLSPDSKILTVKFELDFPDAPREVSVVLGDYGSGTEKYARVENP